ncbi:MHS family proline/betaine transporter-like MFS transporter [Prauserella sediminis]|uniref:MHS family proline/betaine transporter-like MFS transporter n=1 Tax=Prauserella sediminis TaxID=577680 RepID=A0A839XW13_9PSEU|nr:MFS transporter [Prauserella sediminis]MBB3665574.1 MHS family proline/betaine transporter-like MFS transporter [Prauserella sediminis]
MSQETRPALTPTAPPRRVATAGLLGTFIEFYDYTLYAFLVVYLAPQFFPADDPATGILATLGVFGAGYVARPLGAVFFGWLGDRHGRRFALLTTITGMGGATTLMGVLPTYTQIGFVAPLLLVVTRLAQGFSAGGEVGGASTFVAESDGGRRRGLMQSFVPMGSAFGVAAAPAAVGLTAGVLGPEAMAAWGWRVPLLFSAVLAVLVLIYRSRIEDSAEFRTLKEREGTRRAPFMAAIRGHWRMILVAATLNLANTMILAVLVNYMNVYLLSTLGLGANLVYWLSACCLLISAGGFLLGGSWLDRYGRRSTMLVGYGVAAALVFPLFLAMGGLVDGGTFAVIGAGMVYTLALAFSYFSAPVLFVTMSQAFPVEVRYTSTAVAYNLGAVLGGGVTPALASWLAASGGPWATGWLVVGACVLGIVVVLVLTRRSRELAAEPNG